MLFVHLGKNRQWVAMPALLLALLVAACGGSPVAVEPAIQPTQAVVEETPVEEAAAENEAESSDAPAAEQSAGMNGAVTFVIDAAQSEVRFTLTELLMGTPTTVVGRGNSIEGSVAIDFGDYSRTQISPIVIDAGVLATDNNMRNGQIRRAILQTNNADFQYITFTPTALEGLPASAAVGEAFNFSVTGDLTIRTVTQPVTFDVSVTPLSESEIQGSATATVLRADFDLQIPSVPSVADVSEEVGLAFDFVALAE